ncbi:MAG: lipoate--protein ligase [Gammaproteobacteria bacterium]|jgi:lipoate---protein ligase
MSDQMNLRVIDFGTQPDIRSQAIYHGIARQLGSDDDPVLTLVNPANPYVCVGRHQSVELEVDEDFCRANGLAVIRREVGGGAVYLDHNQLFFHFIYPRRLVPALVERMFPIFIEPVVNTYRRFGVEAVLRPINDIHVKGRKIGGTGAAHIDDASVAVGSFMFDFDFDMMAQCLRVPSEKFRDKLRQGLGDYITTMRRELGQPPSREAVIGAFLEQVARDLAVNIVASEPTGAELERIAEQERALTDPEWTYSVGRRLIEKGIKLAAGTHLTLHDHKAPGGLIRVQLLSRDGYIRDLDLTGDFTCLPDSAIPALVRALHGVRLERAALMEAIEAVYARTLMQTPGVTSADFAEAILAAEHRD